ncbi:hypothetical protein AB6A40_009869 [Gnathostoma spinigerum]|uniref:RBR-type E3 ubiquitin transferase n=1 Tax=Gnathostoma spinigerum TaxID=75299 RepID=A0ABD6F2B2_9BILA
MLRRFGGRRKLEKYLEEIESSQWIEDNSKPCPKCRVKIEKDSGCNKMHCSKCDTNFCWLCGVTLDYQDPYGHYNLVTSKCFNRLMEGVEFSDDSDDSDEGFENPEDQFNWDEFLQDAIDEEAVEDAVEFLRHG